MNWISIASNFASAAFGAILGSVLAAYAIGRWRGTIDAAVQQLRNEQTLAKKSRGTLHEAVQPIPGMVEWRKQAEGRLDDGAEKLVELPVLQSKLEESQRTLDLIWDDVRSGIKELHTRVSETREKIEKQLNGYVTQGECDRQHKTRRTS